MAFVTSIISIVKDRRFLTMSCYHYSRGGAPDEQLSSHGVNYPLQTGEKRPGVHETYQKHGWGKRGRLPICPTHRKAGDEDWPIE